MLLRLQTLHLPHPHPNQASTATPGWRLAWLSGLIPALLLAISMAAAHAAQVGEPAPDFTLPGSDGHTYRLSDYRGKQAVVIAWFPKAHTHGCTIECKSLADNGPLIRQFDVTYFMASVDPLAQNKSFALDTGADFPLLSDEDKSVAKAYGVLGLTGVAKRHTFYIDKQGIIQKIDTDIRPASSAEDMVNNLARLGIARRANTSPAP